MGSLERPGGGGGGAAAAAAADRSHSWPAAFWSMLRNSSSLCGRNCQCCWSCSTAHLDVGGGWCGCNPRICRHGGCHSWRLGRCRCRCCSLCCCSSSCSSSSFSFPPGLLFGSSFSGHLQFVILRILVFFPLCSFFFFVSNLLFVVPLELLFFFLLTLQPFLLLEPCLLSSLPFNVCWCLQVAHEVVGVASSHRSTNIVLASGRNRSCRRGWGSVVEGTAEVSLNRHVQVAVA
mmetsp:Transcript_39041/g.58941  ORF Transcript_39041/g.58941 Transcript_39041/m.58941 type:complete len:233 (-) Transcript_39041:30-728(-)